MDLKVAERKARWLMDQHGLAHWTFQWDNAVRRFGACNFTYMRITVSKKLAAVNSEEEVTDTILHEIAHALAGHSAGHGKRWQRKAREVGARAERTYDAVQIVGVEPKYTAICKTCGHKATRHRLPKNGGVLACKACCVKYNGGQFSHDYVMVFKETKGVKA